MRTLVDIPDEDLKLIKSVTRKLGVSRAEFVRRAIDQSLTLHRGKMNHSSFGAWRDFPEDGLEYQQKIRSEW